MFVFAAFDGLAAFSHVWLIFVFHAHADNSTISTSSSIGALNVDPIKGPEHHVINHNNSSADGMKKTKVFPPRLMGEKVGIYELGYQR